MACSSVLACAPAQPFYSTSARTRRPSQLPAMPDTESDHHSGDAAVARLDLVATPAAAATTTSICATGTGTDTARDEEEEDGFTFAAAVDVAIPRLQDANADDYAFPDARISSLMYPVFGRPRRSLSLPKQQERQDEIEEVEDEEDSTAAVSGTATVRRVPLGWLLLQEEQGAPSAAAELNGVPAEIYCLWSPGVSPRAPAGSSRRASPARLFRKSGSTGSSVLRWRRKRRRSHSDGKDDKFVSLGTSSDCIGAGEGEGQGWINRGSPSPGRAGGKSSSSTAFLQCKQDLVELATNAVTCGRSCYLF